MAANIPNGPGLCALCNNDILDWGPAYRPPGLSQESQQQPIKRPPPVRLESAEEIIAGIRKLDTKEIPEPLSSSPKGKKKVKKSARTIQPEMTSEPLNDDSAESTETVIRGKLVSVEPSPGYSLPTSPISRSPPTTLSPLSRSPPSPRSSRAASPPRVNGRSRPASPPFPKDHPVILPAANPPSTSTTTQPEDDSAKEKTDEVQSMASTALAPPTVNQGNEPGDDTPSEPVPVPKVEAREESATYDDLYKRYVTKNPGKIGSLSPQQASFFDPAKYLAPGEETVTPQPVTSTVAATTTTITSRGFDITQEVQTGDDGSGDDDGGDQTVSDTIQPQPSTPKGITINGSYTKVKSGSILSTSNLTSGQESRLKYLEDYFEVLPTDDDETAEIKRKLVSKMKHKRQLSLQKNGLKLEEDTERGAAGEDESPKSPASPYPDTPIQGSEEEESGPRGHSMTENSNEPFEVTRDHWMKDERATKCSIAGCEVVFTFWNRRHHCRKCGDIICYDHSKHVLNLNRFAFPDPKGIPCKVCDECYNNYRTQEDRQSVVLKSSDTSSTLATDKEDDQVMRGQFAQRQGQRGEVLDWLPAHFNEIHFHSFPRPTKVDTYCGDCGCTLPTGFMSAVRFCEATGRYFCVNCHTGKKATIPGKVLESWDFTKYEVCDRACTFLTSIYFEPSYSIDALNPQLYETVKPLGKIKGAKKQVEYLLNYLNICTATKSTKVQSILRSLQSFDPVKYSMSDLARTEDGTLFTEYTDSGFEVTQHVLECELCKAKGYICEICQDPRPYYPFQIGICVQCPDCKTFFHKDCFAKVPKCPKCERIQKYKQKQQKQQKTV